MDDVLNNREDKLPKIGMYNAGQKLLFFVLIASMCGLLLSGIVIWRAYFAFYFPIDVVRLAALLHAFGVCADLLHHRAHLRGVLGQGSIGAMVRGTVTYGWARKHHRAGLKKWFARQD
jgi:formate dehydrogenase subunit gamma